MQRAFSLHGRISCRRGVGEVHAGGCDELYGLEYERKLGELLAS